MAGGKQVWRLFVDNGAANGTASGASRGAGSVVALGEDEHHYAFHVLRLAAGERVEVGDGRGWLADGVLETCDRKGATVRVEAVREEQRVPVPVTLFLAMPKPVTLVEVVSQAAEMGVARIVVFRSARCQSKAPAKHDKLARQAREALRISKGTRAPVIEVHDAQDVLASARFAESVAAPSSLFLCDESPLHDPYGAGHNGLHGALAALAAEASSPTGEFRARGVAVIVGPEASFTPEERTWFLSRGAHAVSLGPFILRVPTAAASSLALAMGTFNVDWET